MQFFVLDSSIFSENLHFVVRETCFAPLPLKSWYYRHREHVCVGLIHSAVSKDGRTVDFRRLWDLFDWTRLPTRINPKFELNSLFLPMKIVRGFFKKNFEWLNWCLSVPDRKLICIWKASRYYDIFRYFWKLNYMKFCMFSVRLFSMLHCQRKTGYYRILT